MLYSQKKVKLPADKDRRDQHTANDGGADDRTDDNIDERIQKFHDQLEDTYWYRIPLKFLCDIGFVNTPIKFNTKWRLTFETNMSRLFEIKTNLTAGVAYPDTVDAKIILESAPNLLFHQFSLEDTYRAYFEGAMISNQLLRTGIKYFPYQKSYELVTGSQPETFTFTNAFKQFAFLEFSLVFDKSDQHLNIYDSYNAETAATSIKYLKLQNASNTYSEFNTIKLDLTDEEDRYILYNAFVAWVTKGSSIVPESDYLYNEVRQELPTRNKYFTDSDEKVYIDIRRSKGYTGEFERVNRNDSDLVVTVDLKAAAGKKMRLYVTGYYQGEYMYMLTKEGLVMNHKEYSTARIKIKSSTTFKKDLIMIKKLKEKDHKLIKKRRTYKKKKLNGRGIARPYVNKRDRLMLGEGKKKKTVKKQTGGFLAPLVAAFAPAAVDLISEIFKYKLRRKITRRNRIVIVKRQNPKKMTLPNGRTFYANIRERRQLNYQQTYIFNEVIDKELHHLVGEKQQCNRVEEVLKVHLKKF